MATDTFEYCVSVGAPGKIPVTVNSAQFGDGYSQVSEMGLNDAM